MGLGRTIDLRLVRMATRRLPNIRPMAKCPLYRLNPEATEMPMHAVLPKGLSGLCVLALAFRCGQLGVVEQADPGFRAPINSRFKLKVGPFLR